MHWKAMYSEKVFHLYLSSELLFGCISLCSLELLLWRELVWRILMGLYEIVVL